MPTSFTLTDAVLDTPDPRGLARFYQALLGWPLGSDDPEWVTLRPPGGGAGLSFQLEEDHVPPVWPAGPGDARMQVHLDIEVDDLAAAVAQGGDVRNGPVLRPETDPFRTSPGDISSGMRSPRPARRP